MLAVWALALFGTLQVYRWQGLLGHAICGPWGCGPPVSALIGYHSFWLLLLVLPAWWLQLQLSSATLQRLGTGLTLVAAVGIVLLLAVDSWQFWSRASMRVYIVQRCLFRLATFIDFPLVQFGLIGLWLRNSWRSKLSESESTESDQKNVRCPSAQAGNL